jgi:hypothetical protein
LFWFGARCRANDCEQHARKVNLVKKNFVHLHFDEDCIHRQLCHRAELLPRTGPGRKRARTNCNPSDSKCLVKSKLLQLMHR